jgi:cytochrome c-type biogenesis protein CcmE
MTKRHTVLVVAILAAVVLAGCDYLPFGYTPIRDIVAAPANFEGKEVKLKGKVKDITRVPIVELKSFALQDDTGEISVTTQGNLPAVNDTVTLKGTVTSMAIIGGQALGLHVSEIKRLP